MPDIPMLPDHLRDSPGVMMTSPPADIIEKTEGIISRAVASLGEGERGALVWIASQQGDRITVNLALVQKVNEHFTVTGWIGKSHGTPIEAGIAGKLVW